MLAFFNLLRRFYSFLVALKWRVYLGVAVKIVIMSFGRIEAISCARHTHDTSKWRWFSDRKRNGSWQMQHKAKFVLGDASTSVIVSVIFEGIKSLVSQVCFSHITQRWSRILWKTLETLELLPCRITSVIILQMISSFRPIEGNV